MFYSLFFCFLVAFYKAHCLFQSSQEQTSLYHIEFHSVYKPTHTHTYEWHKENELRSSAYAVTAYTK